MKYVKLFIVIFGISTLTVLAQDGLDSISFRPLDESALNTVIAFFRYDSTLPLDGRTIEKYESRTYIREKIVFTGVRGDRVPGFLAIPKTGNSPYPLVLLFHVGAGSKESWWNPTSFERGQIVTDSLLSLNIAVLALDAQYHGERSINADFLPIDQMCFDKKWYYRYRDGIIQTIGDYLRAVDYLSERQSIDVNRLGVFGHSMGGGMALIYAALDKRVSAVAAAVGILTDPWMFPLSSINIAGGIKAPTLILAGSQDNLISLNTTDIFFSSIGSEVKELALYDSGHRLPEANISRSVDWFVKYLK